VFEENPRDDKQLPAAARGMVTNYNKKMKNVRNKGKEKRIMKGGRGGRARNDYFRLLVHGVATTALRKSYFHRKHIFLLVGFLFIRSDSVDSPRNRILTSFHSIA
jgi:hypothetical protein